MAKKFYKYVCRCVGNWDMFKVSHNKKDSYEYWKRLEGIDQPVIKKRH